MTRPALPEPYEWGEEPTGDHWPIMKDGRQVGSYGGVMLKACGWDDIPYTIAKIEREMAR